MIARGEDQQGWIFNNDLRQLIAANLRSFTRSEANTAGTRKAAVAVTVTNVGAESMVYGVAEAKPDAAALVLTRRSARLQNHAGQWALPGGSLDEGEKPAEAALRELQEEVNIALHGDSVLGMLDDFTTRSGYTITPVVVWGGRDPDFTANPAEVASIHRIPMSEFMREDAPVLESIPESPDPVLLMPVGQGWIASPTGAILYQFREVALRGRNVRVAHFEQPYFAWQ